MKRDLNLVLWVAICVLLAGTAGRPYAQAPAGTRELLNSERIAERFGSYGIEVIESDGRVRVSNLFSARDGERTCRTFAVVRYPDRIDPAVAAEHDEIVRGGSIGAVFAANGWRVSKTHLRFFEVGASPRVAGLMHVGAGTQLAAHAYVLDVSKGGRAIEYALLVEIHHPEYLTLADLRGIYGTADATGRERSLEALLATAREKTAAGAPIGVAAWLRDGELCLAMPAPALSPGSTVTLIQPAPEQSMLVATISGSAPSCERLERALIPGPYYLARATPKTADSGAVWVALSGRIGTRRGGSGAIVVRLSSPYPNAQVRSCTSQEGLHLTVWAGTPLKSLRLWHQYYYLGYDVEPSCDDRDVSK